MAELPPPLLPAPQLPEPALPADLLQRFKPSPDGLLHLLRVRIDDAMLQEMAEKDHGYCVEEHLQELRRIRDTGKMPVPLKWEPREVLALTQWSEPGGSEATLRRGHLMRAFACAALLRAGGEPGFVNRVGENDTLAQLLASAAFLGPEVQAAVASLVAWRVPYLGIDEERPFFALALLVCSVPLRKRFREQDLARLAKWVMAEERWERYHPDGLCFGEASPWLLGLTVYDQRHNVWRSVAGMLREAADGMQSPTARESVQAVAERLLNG